MPGNQSAALPDVITTAGQVRGRIDDRGVMAFLGIPYAASTAGENRFQPPLPRTPWDGVFDASSYGPSCPQIGMGLPIDTSSQSEDCLRLNVWTRAADADRPVMVWLHGGAFRTGNDRAGGIEGANLVASADVVVVSLNHRIGVMGHLQPGPEFGPGFEQSANAGMLDIAAALAWVRDNIARFGGDPGNVTLFGISGGGAKTLHAMAMPAFNGLFHRAIAIDPHDMWKRNTRAAAERSSRAILDKLGLPAGDRAGLLSVPAPALVDAQIAAMNELDSDPDWGGPAWAAYDIMSPSIDGSTLPAWHADAIAAGASAQVDLMLLSNQLTHWLPQAGLADHTRYGWLDWSELGDALQPYLRDKTSAIIAAYRGEFPGASPSALLATIITDREWLMPTLRIAKAKAAGGKPAYVLHSSAKGTHLADLLFGETGPNPLTRMRAMTATPPYGAGAGHALTGFVTRAIVGFATNGRPDCGDFNWTAHDVAHRNVLMLETEATMVAGPFDRRLAAWDQ